MRPSTAQTRSILTSSPVDTRSSLSWFAAHKHSLFRRLLACVAYAYVAVFIFLLIGVPLLLTLLILA